jgi:Na+-driven multidrug efflux pump
VRLTLAWFLVNRLGMGLMGAWTAMVIDLWLRGTITFLRFRSGRWKSIKV